MLSPDFFDMNVNTTNKCNGVVINQKTDIQNRLMLCISFNNSKKQWHSACSLILNKQLTFDDNSKAEICKKLIELHHIRKKLRENEANPNYWEYDILHCLADRRLPTTYPHTTVSPSLSADISPLPHTDG